MKAKRRRAKLADMLAIAAVVDRAEGLRTAEEYDCWQEMQAERWAEEAWLRKAESAGWYEAFMEDARDRALGLGEYRYE